MRHQFNRETAIDILLLFATTWACHFLMASSFGLYEDDWWRVPRVAEASIDGFLRHLTPFLFFQAGQGRPLHDSFILGFCFIGWRMGGLQAIYWIGFTILACNAALIYLLFRRLSQDRFLALSGAVAFIAFPADTTRPLLTHALGVQPSVSFLLLAFHACLSRRRWLSFLCAVGSLMTYETVFLVFLAAPLLSSSWDRRLARELLKHGAMMAMLLFSALWLRKLTGESRVEQMAPMGALLNSAYAIVLGPAVSMGLYVFRPLWVLAKIKTAPGELYAVVLLSFAAFFYWLRRPAMGLPSSRLPSPHMALGRFVVVGLLMVVLAYPFAFTLSPAAISGRATRVHSAAAIGMSLMFGAVASAGMFWAAQRGKPRAARLAVAASLALLAGFSVMVQSDYRLGWSLQRDYWTQFVNLDPTVSEGSVFILDPPVNPEQIQAFSWTTPLVLERIYRFPRSWQTWTAAIQAERASAVVPPPRVFLLTEEWLRKYCSGQELFESSALRNEVPLFATYDSVPPNVQWLKNDGGRLTLDEPPCGGRAPERRADRQSQKLTQFATRPMYNYLIR